MAESSIPRIVNLGFREFLFYIVPGAILVTSGLIIFDVAMETIERFTGFLGSTAAILASYFLGQVNYALSYPLRRPLRYLAKKFKYTKGEILTMEGAPEFLRMQLKVIKEDPTFYYGEVARYRSLARSYITLCIPSVILTWALASSAQSQIARTTILSLGLVVAAAFAMRFLRCDRWYHEQVCNWYQDLKKSN